MRMIEARVCGIPALIRVDHYFAQAAFGRYCDSRDDCYGYEELEYTVCDSRGRPAPWLDKKLEGNSQEIDRLQDFVINEINETNY